MSELGQADRPVRDADGPVLARLSRLDRLLPVWIVAAMALGLVLGLTLPAVAQTAGSITGTIVDESGGTLPGTTVTLTGGGLNRSVVTNAEGKYRFVNVSDGTYTVAGNLTGFGSATKNDVKVAGKETEVGAMTLAIVLRGEEVVVTASKVESQLVDAPATISVVSSETIASSPAQNYGDLLRSVPGLNIIQMSARDVNITSRQATSTLSNSQLTLLDGRSIYLDFFGLVLWDLVPSNPADIKQIEVVRGPASAVWGANAMTGVVNILTKSPREAEGGSITLNAGMFSGDSFRTDAAGNKTEISGDTGHTYGGQFTYAGVPNEDWSYRLSAGYNKSDAFARPQGQVPASKHPFDINLPEGGGTYPNFGNEGTKQPKADLRLDRELGDGEAKLSFSGGYAGTSGIVHTGIGPFRLEDDSYLAYGRLGYTRGGLKVAAFVNNLDGKAPNLLSVDATGAPIQLNFVTRTFDFEVGNSHVLGADSAVQHVISYGGNVRKNTFDISIAKGAEDRNDWGVYLQDEIFVGQFRFVLGGRVDKFGSVPDRIFSPRLSAIFKPAEDHAIRVSYNKAFRAPSTINNFLDVNIVQPVDLRAVVTALGPLGPLVQPILAPTATGGLFPLTVRAAGSDVVGNSLREESVTAYEVGYTGTFNGQTTVGAAFYINDSNNNINFITSPLETRFFYSAAAMPPGFERLPTLPSNLLGIPGPVRGVQLGQLLLSGALANRLPNTFTYMNIGKLRQKGLELSVDHAFDREISVFANYSYQWDPETRGANDDGREYPISEVGVPPHHRFNAGINLNYSRWLAAVNVNYTSEAFWSDVLGDEFHGTTPDFTMLNATLGLKFLDGKLTTSVKGVNLLNKDVQQHIFGDILRRQVVGEARFSF